MISLQLLRALFGPALEFLYFLLHGSDGLIFLLYLEVQLVFCFFPGYLPGSGKTLLYAFLNGQFQFAFGVVEFTLLLDQFCLRVLRFGQFCIALFEDFLQIGQLPRFLLQIVCRCLLGFPALIRRNSCAILFQLLLNLICHLFIKSGLGLRGSPFWAMR